jgi:hypothetical protein
MEATCPSEMSVDFQRTTRRYIPGDRTLRKKQGFKFRIALKYNRKIRTLNRGNVYKFVTVMYKVCLKVVVPMLKDPGHFVWNSSCFPRSHLIWMSWWSPRNVADGGIVTKRSLYRHVLIDCVSAVILRMCVKNITTLLFGTYYPHPFSSLTLSL